MTAKTWIVKEGTRTVAGPFHTITGALMALTSHPKARVVVGTCSPRSNGEHR